MDFIYWKRKYSDVYRTSGVKGVVNFTRQQMAERSTKHPEHVPFIPRHIQLEVTSKCNLDCEMCPRSIYTDSGRHMTLDEIKRIRSQFPDLFSITLQGLGEPLMNPDFPEIVRWLRSEKIRVNTVTNATFLNERIIRQLHEADLSSMTISMDGATKETFETIRRGANFDKVSANVARLGEYLKDNNWGLKVNLQFVAMPKNYKEVEEFIRFAHRCSIKMISVQPVFEYSDDVSLGPLLEEQLAELNELKPLAQELGITYMIPAPSAARRTGFKPCRWPWAKLYVAVEGEVLPCCAMQDPSVFQLGNIYKEPLTDIWNSEKYKQFRHNMVHGPQEGFCQRICGDGKPVYKDPVRKGQALNTG